jgi:transcription-repair coupling factor (superfamily II helicase)
MIMDDLSPGEEPARSLADAPVADLPVAASAFRLLDAAKKAGPGVIYLARGERRATSTAAMLAGFAPELTVLPFPAWDCVPYDRAGPSRDVMGVRIETMRRLAEGVEGQWIVITTAGALAQRLPPRRQWGDAALTLKVGDQISADALQSFLVRSGYVIDDRVDETGEAAIRGAVIDLFPSGNEGPIRIDHADGSITGIRAYDAVSQRTLEERTELLLAPSSEVVLPEQDAIEHFPGIEHFLPEYCGELETLFDYAARRGDCRRTWTIGRHERFWEQVEDAYETRRSAPRGIADRTPPAADAALP